MAFTINNNLVFIDSTNSSLDALVKNLSEMDFKYLLQEFNGDLLELVKQKGVYPYEYNLFQTMTCIYLLKKNEGKYFLHC